MPNLHYSFYFAKEFLNKCFGYQRDFFGRARGLYGVLLGDLSELGGKELFEVRVCRV